MTTTAARLSPLSHRQRAELATFATRRGLDLTICRTDCGQSFGSLLAPADGPFGHNLAFIVQRAGAGVVVVDGHSGEPLHSAATMRAALGGIAARLPGTVRAGA